MTRTAKTLSGAGIVAVLAGGVLLLNQPTTVEPKPHRLLWEHDAQFTPGFVVEEKTSLDSPFTSVGFVDVMDRISTNLDGTFTYEFQLTNNHPQAFYRVGATL